MNDTLSLTDHFLVAMPSLMDLNFSQALVYICAHNEEGTMGVVVNRPMLDINLSNVLQQMEVPLEDEKIGATPVYLGGPIQPDRGFIVHCPNTPWQSTLTTSEQLAVTSSQDILQAIAKGGGPDEVVIILGYSGWGPGQLEEEIAKNFWLTVPADPKILFKTPYSRRWQAAAESLGIDISSISGDVGHA